MVTICGIISHLCSLESSTEILPNWAQDLIDILNDMMVHKNIKIFILKVIENNKEYLKPWGKWIIGSVMNAISSGVLGNDINYFMSDLVS